MASRFHTTGTQSQDRSDPLAGIGSVNKRDPLASTCDCRSVECVNFNNVVLYSDHLLTVPVL
jgi:hypothetical protein